jgi:hypothetical protein
MFSEEADWARTGHSRVFRQRKFAAISIGNMCFGYGLEGASKHELKNNKWIPQHCSWAAKSLTAGRAWLLRDTDVEAIFAGSH